MHVQITEHTLREDGVDEDSKLRIDHDEGRGHADEEHGWSREVGKEEDDHCIQ